MKKIFIPVIAAALSLAVISSATAGNGFLEKAANSFMTANGASGTTGAASTLSSGEIGSGLKEALRVGTEKVVGQLGKADGFNSDPKIHIPLPGMLQKANKTLTAMGMGGMTSDLELRLNRAAEAATPKAKALFVDAIQKMTITDAKGILTGPKDSATQYLKKSMSPELSKAMQPIVQNALADAGAIKSYDKVMGQYSQLPFVSGAKENLNSYVVDKAMSGIFYYVGQQEAAIRTNPAARTTDLLKKVFSTAK